MITEVSTSIRISYDGSRQQVRVSWNFVFDMRGTSRPLHVDGVSVYSLNVRGQVRKHVIEIIIVNGTPAKPPFAQAWINLPSWLAEGLKGGTAVPGLSSSQTFSFGLSKDTLSSCSVRNTQACVPYPVVSTQTWTTALGESDTKVKNFHQCMNRSRDDVVFMDAVKLVSEGRERKSTKAGRLANHGPSQIRLGDAKPIEVLMRSRYVLV